MRYYIIMAAIMLLVINGCRDNDEPIEKTPKTKKEFKFSFRIMRLKDSIISVYHSDDLYEVGDRIMANKQRSIVLQDLTPKRGWYFEVHVTTGDSINVWDHDHFVGTVKLDRGLDSLISEYFPE